MQPCSETREANPTHYWFQTYDVAPRFFWNEIEITEKEFRANADREALKILGGAR